MGKEILILVPTEREAEFLARHGLRAEICGAGMAECAAASGYILASRRPDMAILAGVAGSYVDELVVGESVAVASETVADLGRVDPDGSFIPLFQKTCQAGFVPEALPAVHSNTVNVAGFISHSAGAVIENMEGAAFFAVCSRFGVPAMELRTISNRVGQPVTSENLTLAAQNLARTLAEIIRHL
jgi:nucleoside phosphorylase